MTTRRYSPTVLASIAARLTRRDRQLMRMVWEHRVLTAPQITELAFSSDDTARKRLLNLYDMGVLDRFQPNLPVGAGSAPFHYVLGETGAAILAAEDGTALADFGYQRYRTLAIAYSRKLSHTVGVNGFFTALTAHARRTPDAELIAWWPEHRCTKIWGDKARPDAYGQWREHGLDIDFFLEYDTGTENLERVAAKLGGYHRLAQATGITTPVAFWVHSERREANLRARLGLHPAAPLIPIATGHRSALLTASGPGPAGEVWLPLDTQQPRYRLAALIHAWPHLSSQAPAEEEEP